MLGMVEMMMVGMMMVIVVARVMLVPWVVVLFRAREW